MPRVDSLVFLLRCTKLAYTVGCESIRVGLQSSREISLVASGPYALAAFLRSGQGTELRFEGVSFSIRQHCSGMRADAFTAPVIGHTHVYCLASTLHIVFVLHLRAV